MTFNLIADRIVRTVVALVMGFSGTSVIDPAFGTRITRVTDASLSPKSYRTPSSEQQVAWSHLATRFYTTRTDGTITIFAFNNGTSKVDRTLPFNTEPTFSQVDDDVIYGTVGTQVRSYRFSTSTWTTLADPKADDPTHFGLYLGGTVQSSATVERVIYFYGGNSQDHHYRVVVLDPKTLAKQTIDTLAETLNGTAVPNAFNGGVNIHAVAIDRTGTYAIIYPPGESTANGIAGFSQTNGKFNTYIWNIPSGAIYPITWAMHPYGHSAFGYGTLINQDNNKLAYDGVQYQFRSLADVANPVDLINPPMTPKEAAIDGHPNWNAASPTLTTWFVEGTERYFTGTLNTTPWRAWDDEILLMPTTAGGTVYRVCHHRSADENPDGSLEFWATPRPQQSPDMRWILFTSNWGRTLGKDADGTTDRQDVFLVETRRVNVLSAPRLVIRSGS